VGTPEPARVEVGGVEVTRVDPEGIADGGWSWTPAVGGTLSVRAPADQTVVVTLEEG
jgi:hypothetical protein